MKAVFLFSLAAILLCAKAWPAVKNPFELESAPIEVVHTLTDCIHVTSESGDFVFRKTPHSVTKSSSQQDIEIVETTNPMTVCGLFVVGEPNTIVEIKMKHIDVDCEAGGLLGFVDGWELNGEYFPGAKDTEKTLKERTKEFCNDYSESPVMLHQKVFRSSQNAALLQYRIPIRGSFTASVHFHNVNEPCNILVQDTLALYTLNNFGHHRNCTLTAIFPAVISLMNVHIGKREENRANKLNYECQSADRLEIGGSSGLDSHDMEKSNEVCGHTELQGPEQAIFCGVTSVRLVSSGKYENDATILIRQANEKDLENSALVCPL